MSEKSNEKYNGTIKARRQTWGNYDSCAV